MYYAQLNKNNICFAISQLKSKIDNPKMIEVNELDGRFLEKKYKDNKFYGLKLEAEKDKIEVNEEVKINIKWLDLEENLVSDNTEITVFVNREEKTRVTAERGVLEIEFTSEEPGLFDIEAVCKDGCRATARIEVVENG